MKTKLCFKTLCGCTLLLAALPAWSAAQAGPAPQPQTAAPAQSATVCGNQPLCTETADFAVTISNFRTSTTGWNIIDTTLHFINKTAHPLVLAYSDGSAMALDDQGNRYGMVGGANGIRGMGRVAGNSIDPRFVMQAGGNGDALFELGWPPNGRTQGFTFELDLSVREITPLEGNQFAVASEFPLRFQGLKNGVAAAPASGFAGTSGGASGVVQSVVSGGAPAVVSGGAPVCGPGTSGIGNAASTAANTANSAAGQNATGAANSTMAQASATIASFKSMFGRKKAAQAPAPAASSSGNPCVPAASAPSATGTSPAVAAGAPAATAPQVSTAYPAARAQAPAARVATTPNQTASGTAKPATATTKPTTTTAAKTPSTTPKPAQKPATATATSATTQATKNQ
jgi:hypothetical protein